MKAHSTGLRVLTPEFYLVYTNLSISEKSPLWKVFLSHILVHYRIGYNNIFFETSRSPFQNLGGRNTPNPWNWHLWCNQGPMDYCI